MAIDFPNSPTTGDLHTVNGKQWQWDAEKWIAYGVSLAPDVLKVDSGNNRVGINQTSPAYSLDVTGTARITGDLTVQGTTTTIESAAVNTSLVFEGATADAYETTLTLVDPTADRTITLPNNTGTVALTTDNVASATALANARTIGGVSFDGTANIAVTLAATATALANARTIGGTSFDGTANITPANATLAATATALATARTIGGTSFDGTANITPANATLAATATALATGRTINGVSFDGTANITVVDSAALPLAGGTMTGAIAIGVNGTGYDFTAYGDTAGVYMNWDESEDQLVIEGYNATTALDVTCGNVEITDTLTVSGGLVAPLAINPQVGTTYTFVLADAGKLVTSSNTSAQTFTVPPTLSPDFPVGTQIMVQNINTANCTLAQGSGVTITSKDSNKEIDGRYAAATLIKTATNAWTLIGALA